MLERAIDIVQKAIIDEDRQQNFAEALKLYQNSLDYFILALKYEKNVESKAMIKDKINEYLQRAEMLKSYLQVDKRVKSAVDCPGKTSFKQILKPLDRARDIAHKAIDEDGKQNYSEAFKLYQNAIYYLLQASKNELDEKTKTMIDVKINIAEYLERAERLEAHLQRDMNGKSSIGRNCGLGPAEKASIFVLEI